MWPPPWREREREGGGPDAEQRESCGGIGRDGACVGGDDHRNHGRWIPGTGDDRGSDGDGGRGCVRQNRRADRADQQRQSEPCQEQRWSENRRGECGGTRSRGVGGGEERQ